MNILILTEHFLPIKGGSVNWMVNTYSRYAPEEIIFVASRCKGDKIIDNTLPFQVERIPMIMADCDPTIPSSLFRYIQIIWHVHKICQKFAIQQIHCAKVMPEGLVAWWINLLDSIPYLLYSHGEEITASLTSRKFCWLTPKIYNGASAIIANSRNTKSLLENIGVSMDKIKIIHPGVDTKFLKMGIDARQMIQKRYGLGDSPVILTVGRLQKHKGQDMVIKSIPIIKQKFPDVKYIIAGVGDEYCNLKKIALDMKVNNDIIFANLVSEKDLPAYYAACDVFIMPNRQVGSNIEGFGMVFLEASAAGKPVIGGTSGGTDDAILDGITGIRVDGNNVKSIAKAVINILSDPKKAKAMGDAGRRRAEQEFSWESIVAKTRNISFKINPKQRH